MPYTVLDPALAQAAPVTTIGAPRTTGSGKTLAQLRTELNLLLGQRADVSAARLTDWINDAYLDMFSALDLEEVRASMSFSSVAAQHMYLLPEVVDAITMLSVSDTSTYPMGGRPFEKIDLEMYRTLPVYSDEPGRYFRIQNMLVLYPTPIATGRVISIDFLMQPVILSADNHIPLLRPKWHQGLQMLAKAKAMNALRDFAGAQMAMVEYNGFVGSRINTRALETDNLQGGVRVPRSRNDLHINTQVNDAI